MDTREQQRQKAEGRGESGGCRGLDAVRAFSRGLSAAARLAADASGQMGRTLAPQNPPVRATVNRRLFGIRGEPLCCHADVAYL